MEKLRTSDLKFYELCQEIDSWKEEANYWKSKYEEQKEEYDNLLNRGLKDSKNMVGQLLSLTLQSVPTEEGLLIKNKEKCNEKEK